LLNATQTSPSRTAAAERSRVAGEPTDAGRSGVPADPEIRGGEPEISGAEPEPRSVGEFVEEAADSEETVISGHNGDDPALVEDAGVEEAEETPVTTAVFDPPAEGPEIPTPHPVSFDSHMEIRFAKLKDEATLPTRANEGDAGMDLCAAEAARIGPGQRVGVGTGLAVEIPEGWAGMVLPRSGLALKHGIALVNSPGLIDPGYRGEIRVLLLNTDATSEFKVSVGDRIAQLLLTPFSTAKPVEASALDASTRGEGGFGSSGV